MSTPRSFELGAFVLPLHAGVELSESWEPLGGESLLRMMNGALFAQRQWSRWRITISGSGTLPPGLWGVDFSVPQLLKSSERRCVQSGALAIALPAGRRSDVGYAPYALALMPDLTLVRTAAVLAGDVLTATAVAGAIRYEAAYWPQLTVKAREASLSAIVSGAERSWQLVCEEV